MGIGIILNSNSIPAAASFTLMEYINTESVLITLGVCSNSHKLLKEAKVAALKWRGFHDQFRGTFKLALHSIAGIEL